MTNPHSQSLFPYAAVNLRRPVAAPSAPLPVSAVPDGTLLPDFFALFRTRLSFFQGLEDLATDQQACILAEDYAELLAILGRKQTILARLEDDQRRMPHLLPLWKANREQLEPQVRQACEDVLLETEALVVRLNRLEAECTATVARRREETLRELTSVNQQRQLLSAYQPVAPTHNSTVLDLNR